jgi:outer membrane receptor protein involved in Fe transport
MDIRSHDTTLYVIDSVFHVAGDSLVFDSLERKQAWHAEKSNRDLLPAASIIFTLSDDMNLRFAYGHTLARPTFREIAPYVSYYPAEGLSVRGNIGLERSTIDNYDVRWEWFMRPGELFAVSPFLKIFTNPIEVSLIPTDNDEITWENSERATVGGIEFEARKKLDQVHRTMKDVTMGGNLSLIYARVDIPQKKLLVMREINPDAPAARAFQGQSPYVLNVNLTYDNGDLTGTSANLYYNIFGRRLHYFSRDLTPDLMEEPRNIFNGNFSQKLWGGLSLKFSVKNILNSPVKYVHRYNETGPEARWYLEMVPFFEYLPFFKKYQGKEYVREEHREGRSFSLGLTYTIK